MSSQSSEIQTNSILFNRLQNKQDGGYVTVCCGRAFLSEDSYHIHAAAQEDHTGNSWNEILWKTPVVKITQLPASDLVLFNNSMAKRKRFAPIKRRLYHKQTGGRRTIRCHLCGLLIFGGNLKRHIKNAHVLKSTHKCRWCSCVYGSQKAILLHISRAHPMEQKRCNWDAKAQVKFEKSVKKKILDKDETESNYSKSTHKGSDKFRNGSDANKKCKTGHSRKERIHECIFCGKIYNGKISFLQHLLVHAGEKPYKCEVCGEEFVTTNEICQHVDTWHADFLKFKCDRCPGLFYNTQESYERHLQIRHVATTVSEGSSSSTEDKHNSDSDKNDDEDTSENKPSFNVDTKFKKAEVLQLKAIKVENGYKCQICSKVLKELAYYRAHRLLHTDIFPFSCPKCQRKFRTKSNRDNHAVMSHVENGDYQCEECCCRFSSRFGLKCHFGIYHKKGDGRGKRWQMSAREGYGYKKAKNLKIKSGLYSKTVAQAQAVRNENGYGCKICGKTLASPFAYNGHMLIHTNELPHKCKQCPAKFRLTSTRDRHVKTNHVENGSYKCYLCPCTFDLQRGLTRHLYCYHSGKRKSELKATKAKIKIKRAKRETSYESSTSTEWECEEPKENTSATNVDITNSPMESLENIVNSHLAKKPKKLKYKISKHKTVKVDDEDFHNIESVEVESGFMCSLCGKILKSIYCFRQHRLVHTNLFPHKCHKCSKKFRRRVDRDKHLRVAHIANGEFRCSQCSCTFSAMHSLKSHTNSMHRSTKVD